MFFFFSCSNTWPLQEQPTTVAFDNPPKSEYNFQAKFHLAPLSTLFNSFHLKAKLEFSHMCK